MTCDAVSDVIKLNLIRRGARFPGFIARRTTQAFIAAFLHIHATAAEEAALTLEVPPECIKKKNNDPIRTTGRRTSG